MVPKMCVRSTNSLDVKNVFAVLAVTVCHGAVLLMAVFRSCVALSQGHYQHLNTGPHSAAATQSRRQSGFHRVRLGLAQALVQG